MRTRLYHIAYNIYTLITSPSYRAKKIFKKRMGKCLNFRTPKDLNEKINWLKFNGDTRMWSRLADKYRVREYIEEKGLSSILIPLYKMWENADKINFDELPDSFILKTNHGSGEILVVKDKKNADLKSIKKQFAEYLSTPFGRATAEPHYLKIKPCVIAEKYLDASNLGFTTSLVDYKIWCFDGKPYYIWACYSRTKEKVYVETYDLNWNYHPEKSVFTDHYRDGKGIVPKPKKLDEMLKIASILSEGFPEVRVDLYEHEGKVYFGEMTFTSNGGYQDFYTQEFLDELGSYVKLPID